MLLIIGLWLSVVRADDLESCLDLKSRASVVRCLRQVRDRAQDDAYNNGLRDATKVEQRIRKEYFAIRK